MDLSEQQICAPTPGDMKEAAIRGDQVIKTPLLENAESLPILPGIMLKRLRWRHKFSAPPR
jgi:hypothetical protein